MRKTLACLLIPTFITFYNTNKANALSTEVGNKVINNINNDTNDDNCSLMTRYLNYELEYQRDTFQAKVHRNIILKYKTWFEYLEVSLIFFRYLDLNLLCKKK